MNKYRLYNLLVGAIFVVCVVQFFACSNDGSDDDSDESSDIDTDTDSDTDSDTGTDTDTDADADTDTDIDTDSDTDTDTDSDSDGSVLDLECGLPESWEGWTPVKGELVAHVVGITGSGEEFNICQLLDEAPVLIEIASPG